MAEQAVSALAKRQQRPCRALAEGIIAVMLIDQLSMRPLRSELAIGWP